MHHRRLLAGTFLLSLVAASALHAAEPAGRVAVVVPAALRNGAPAQQKQELQWNDRIATDKAGRMRAALLDGSVLSLGAASELVVVKHDAASQQTELNLAYGKLRSMVAPHHGVGRAFEIQTATANVGVIGTDFFLDASATTLRVICFSGAVEVRSRADTTKSYKVEAEQMLELDARGDGVVRRASEGEVREALDSTAIEGILQLAPRTRLTASFTRGLDQGKAKVGDEVVVRVNREVKVASAVVIPKGAELVGTVTQVQKRDATHAVAEIAVAFRKLRMRDGHQYALSAVIDGFEAARGLDGPESGSADTAFGEATAERTGRRRQIGLAAPNITPARPSPGGTGTSRPPVPDPSRVDLSDEPLPEALRDPDASLPIVQPVVKETNSGAILKSSQGVHISAGTTLLLRILEP
jgi:hypothetical protein